MKTTTSIKYIQLNKLVIRPEFVRNSDQIFSVIKRDFVWDKFGALIVKASESGNSFYDVVDGIIRTKVLQASEFPGYTQVPCVVLAKNSNALDCRLAYNGCLPDSYLTRCRKNLTPGELFELKYVNKQKETVALVNLVESYDINIRWASRGKRSIRVPNTCYNAEVFDHIGQTHGISHVKKLLDFLQFFRVDGGDTLQSKALQACFLQAASDFLLSQQNFLFGSNFAVSGKKSKAKTFKHLDVDKIYEDSLELRQQGYSNREAISTVLMSVFMF